MRRAVAMGAPAAAALFVAAMVSGCGASGKSSAPGIAPARMPTPAEFAADPSCSFYNSATGVRLRIRAANINFACRFLGRRYPVYRASWTTKPHHFRPSRGNRRYATACRMARSEGRAWVEAEINAPTGRFTVGDYLCANLAAKGWIDLRTRLTAFDVLGLERTHDKELVLVYFCNTLSMSNCSADATRSEERRARSQLQQEPCARQIVFVSKALGQWWLRKEEGIPPLHLGANPLPDSLAIVAKDASCATRIAAAARAAHLPGVQTVRVHS
jgi:FtsX extracellular domain